MSTPERPSFGESIHALRQQKGWTLREAARQIGIAHSRLDEFEKGFDSHSGKAVVPSYVAAVRIALTYDIAPNELLRVAGYKPGKEIAPDEVALLKVYRTLSQVQRRKLWNLIEAF